MRHSHKSTVLAPLRPSPQAHSCSAHVAAYYKLHFMCILCMYVFVCLRGNLQRQNGLFVATAASGKYIHDSWLCSNRCWVLRLTVRAYVCVCVRIENAKRKLNTSFCTILRFGKCNFTFTFAVTELGVLFTFHRRSFVFPRFPGSHSFVTYLWRCNVSKLRHERQTRVAPDSVCMWACVCEWVHGNLSTTNTI